MGEPCAVRMWLFTPLPTATRLMTDATSTASTTPLVTPPDLDRFARLDSLGLSVSGQQIFPDHAVLFCEVTVGDDRCPGCGGRGRHHDTVLRRFTHLPLGHRPTWLQVATPRYECQSCGKVWRHRLRAVARRRSRLTRAAGMWALAAVVLDHVPVSSVARILGIAWHTAHSAVAELGLELLIGHPARLDGVAVIGVDEHCWRHTGFASDRFVTVIVDLTPVRDRSGPARLLDMVEGRSARAFQTWLDAQPDTFRNTVQVVAMDGFTGFKTAAAAAVPDAVAVMDPFHVVALVGDKLDLARQRVQHDTLGHRGHAGDPLYAARRTLLTREGLLTDKQKTRLAGLFADEAHLPVEVGWCVYQDVIACATASRPASTSSPNSDGHCTDDATTSWPGSPTPAPATDRRRRSVSIGVAGLGLAGRVVSVVSLGCDSGGNWPLGCLSVDLSARDDAADTVRPTSMT